MDNEVNAVTSSSTADTRRSPDRKTAAAKEPVRPPKGAPRARSTSAPTSSTLTQQARLLRGVLGRVPASAREEFASTVTSPSDGGLRESLWGTAPSRDRVDEAALWTLQEEYRARREVAARSLTRSQVAELLDVSEQAVTDRLEARELVGLKSGREWRLPVWQFSADAERGYLPGLARLRAVFPGGSVSLTEWATTPNTELEGATPADMLAAERVEEVVRAAAVGTSAAW